MAKISSKELRIREEVAARFADTAFLTAAIAKATGDAALAHKRAGNSIVVGRNGEVVIVPPEEIDALLEAGKK